MPARPRTPVHIRRLTADDAAEFRAIRLRGVREHPDAFLVSAAEEERDDVAAFAARLMSKEGLRDDAILGAFRDGHLVGTVGFFRERFEKTRHRAVIWGMYVAPETRGEGIGRMLLLTALDELRALGDVDVVQLSVVTTNRVARSLYLSAGFRVWGVDRGAWRLAGTTLDEEGMSLRLRE